MRAHPDGGPLIVGVTVGIDLVFGGVALLMVGASAHGRD
jgi:uncharacterized membrane protein HdeD (DUF308 family)